jgi:hypothetical protein
MPPGPRPPDVVRSLLIERYLEHQSLPVEIRDAIDDKRIVPVAEMMELLMKLRCLDHVGNSPGTCATRTGEVDERAMHTTPPHGAHPFAVGEANPANLLAVQSDPPRPIISSARQ